MVTPLLTVVYIITHFEEFVNIFDKNYLADVKSGWYDIFSRDFISTKNHAIKPNFDLIT